jgi:hypothetical protein
LADTFALNPGNPGFVCLGITKEELLKIWRVKLPKLVEKTADPSS